MKFLVLFSALVMSMTVSAESIRASQREVLTHVEVNGQLTRYTGVAQLDFVKSEMTVAIYHDPCGQFTARVGEIRCMAAAGLVTVLRAPIDVRTTSCGSMVYQGSKDQTPADGPRTVIEVLDHSTRLCKDIVPSAFIVKASSYNPWTNETTEYLLMK